MGSDLAMSSRSADVDHGGVLAGSRADEHPWVGYRFLLPQEVFQQRRGELSGRQKRWHHGASLSTGYGDGIIPQARFCAPQNDVIPLPGHDAETAQGFRGKTADAAAEGEQ